MKTLVISDIHNKINIVQKILDKESCADEVIFLGDWFDDFNDGINDVVNVAKFLNSIYTEKKFKFVWGNHDLYYPPFRNFHLCSGGFSADKQICIEATIDPKVWEQFNFCYFTQNFLISHAGTTSKHDWLFEKNKFDLSKFNEVILDAEKYLYTKQSHFMFRAGFSRGGMLPVGGITWCDFHKDFEPYENLNQIFGHTIVNEPSFVYDHNSINLCLDTNLQHYAIINDSQIEIHNVS